MKRQTLLLLAAVQATLGWTSPSFAQDVWQPGPRGATTAGVGHVGDSPFAPPEAADTRFVVDQDVGLDTGCTFRSGDPLVFKILVDRVIGDRDTLLAKGLIDEVAALTMPAFDVDFDASVGVNPERDRVFFNDKPVDTEFLTGANNVWKQNEFSIPVEWINFPEDPGEGNTPTPAENTIRIEIDTANEGGEEAWCTAIDWAALTVNVARPVVMAHGIFSKGSVWNPVWVKNLTADGLPSSASLDMGNLGSISSNAGKIADEIERRKAQWGVQKVVLVGHSKGGLDSREYVETHDDVEQVIQIGTPNAGSPLADAVQSSLVRLGVLPAVILNGVVAAFSGPAGIQLTTWAMGVYNWSHGRNRDVRYTALAGAYDPDCSLFNPFCRPVQRLLRLISGIPGDTIVPVSSVHALGYTNNRTFSRSGTNMEPTHACLATFTSCQLDSESVYSILADRVRAFGAPPRQAAALTQATPTGTVFGSIEEGQTREFAMPVDDDQELFFALFYPLGDLKLSLVSPSGIFIDETSAQPMSGIAHEAGELFGGKLAVFDLLAPEIGVWTLRVTAEDVAEAGGTVGFFASAWLQDPSISMAVDVSPASIHASEEMLLVATLVNAGVPLVDATVTASTLLPDGSLSEVGLLDDGIAPDTAAQDGVYSALSHATALPGNYPIAFLGERGAVAGAPAFSRQGFAMATVSASASSFTGSFSDTGVDTDGDGLFDELRVAVGISITEARNYRISAILEDSQGNMLEAGVEEVLPAGAATVTLSFDGSAIFRNGVDGPYVLKQLRLAEKDGLAILPVEESSLTHTTASYGFLEFEHEDVALAGTGTAVGVDTNGNQLFEHLDVSLGLIVEIPDAYEWTARLVDGNGVEIGFASGSGVLAAGRNDILFRFDGGLVGANGIDGPYFINNLLVSGSAASLVVARAFVAEPFFASQFEGFVPRPTPTATVTPIPTPTPGACQVDDVDGDQVGNDCDDSDVPFAVKRVRVSSARGGVSTIRVRGNFFALDSALFDLSEGLSFHIDDGDGLLTSVAWLASECVVHGSGRVRCVDAARSATLDVRRRNNGRLDLDALVRVAPLADNQMQVVRVQIHYAPPTPVLGIDVVGEIATCTSTLRGTLCRAK